MKYITPILCALAGIAFALLIMTAAGCDYHPEPFVPPDQSAILHCAFAKQECDQVK